MKRSDAAADYYFEVDAPPDEISFSSRLELTGWLFHREKEPIRGLRAVVKGTVGRERIYKARRKRSRPEVGAAYPGFPEAETSGFLLELDHLPPGRVRIEAEVKDQAKNWRRLFVTEIRVVPLDWLGRLRLAHFERELVRQLRRRFGTAEGAPALDLNGLEQIRERIASLATVSEPAAITTVHLFVTSKSNLFIIEIAQLVCAGFRDAGLAAELFVDRIPAEETPNDTLQIVVTPHEFYNLFFSPQFSVEEVRRRSRNLYLLGTEQPESGWFHSNLIVAPYARAILDINLLGVQGYRARGLRCVHLPLGYHPMLAATSEPSPNERDFDLCLLASMTERREQFLAEHADFFSARRCHLRLVPLGFAKTETTKSYLSTERRNSILQRSKILLNVHYSDLRYFEWHRMLIGLANGCCIITETCEGYAPLVPGKHFVMVEKELLIKTCEYYLVHPEEREAIARAGHDFVREHLTQAANCQHCLEQITRGNFFSLGKFPEQTDPTPEGLPAELSSNHRGPSGLRHALVQDLRALFTPTDRVPLTVVQASTDEKAIAVIEERRRGFAERFACQEELEKDGGTPWKIKDNAPYATHPLPTISVVITLYNYERYIRSCVESVEQALRASIPGGIEILIVDDASTDRSLAQAEEVQRKSPLPLRIVAKKFNTGLADARTVGLRIARAPYAFIMDADNLIFPHALELLHAAITKNHTAAAYSILCRFRGQPDNRSGLLSYYDWDPRMLVEHPYIDAMALFDRAQLVALGGYDNDLFKVGWFGWEDYELWLRMAAAHLEATLVPNILCLYRHHESAMSNTTNLFEVDLVRHLLKRYQPLIDEYAPKKRVFGVEWERLA